MTRIFDAIESQGALSIASLPEYWRNHWDDLGAFVVADIDGFETVNCAPKPLAFPSSARRAVVTREAGHDLLDVGARTNHGLAPVTRVLQRSHAGASEFKSHGGYASAVAVEQ